MGRFQDWFERNIAAPDPYDDERWSLRAHMQRAETLRQREELDSLYVDLTPKKPRLHSVTRAPSREDYAAWRDNPITEFVMAALLRNAQEYEDKWHEYSWSSGLADQEQLNSCRLSADTLRGIAEADYEGFCEILNVEPDAPNAA